MAKHDELSDFIVWNLDPLSNGPPPMKLPALIDEWVFYGVGEVLMRHLAGHFTCFQDHRFGGSQVLPPCETTWDILKA